MRVNRLVKRWREARSWRCPVNLLKHGDRCVMPDGRIEIVYSVMQSRTTPDYTLVNFESETVPYPNATRLRVLPRENIES